MADAKMLNLGKVLAKLRRVPQVAQNSVYGQLKTETGGMVDAMKRAAPVGGTDDPHPGQFRDSIHSYANPNRPLSFVIIADAKDQDGKFIGSNIEAGHRTKDGKHVAGRPSFWPTYRARKKPAKRRIAAAGRKAIKQLFPG